MSSVTDAASVATTGSAPSAPRATGGLTFRQFLSDINPLQYIPVVGAVYRAATGDEGNETMRFVASLGTSFALGGPLGLGITVAEKITGIDPERIARSLLHRMLHPGGGAQADAPAASSTADTTGRQVDAANRPWTAAELSAYAASTGNQIGAGATTGGAVTADMLNGLELKRVSALYA